MSKNADSKSISDSRNKNLRSGSKSSETVKPVPSNASNQIRPAGMGMGMGMGGAQQMQMPMMTMIPMIPVYEPIKGVPLGLEPLVGIESVYVQQELEMIEILTGFETCNRYHVMNNFGFRIYFAGETSDCCARQCLGRDRPFTMTLFSGQGLPVISMSRECNRQLCFWGASCAGSNIEVKSVVTGELLGRVVQNCNGFTPSYKVLDWKNQEILYIEGPCGSGCCPVFLWCDAMFAIYLSPEIATNLGIPKEGEKRASGEMQKRKRKPSRYTKDKVLVGSILKKFQAVEFISKANFFGVQFSPELDPRTKAVLIGATFCIDFSYFEKGTACAGCEVITVTIVLIILVGLLLLMNTSNNSQPPRSPGQG